MQLDPFGLAQPVGIGVAASGIAGCFDPVAQRAALDPETQRHLIDRTARSYAPGDKLVYGHIGTTVPRVNVRAELLAELAAMCDHDERYEQTGREVGRLAVGDVVVLEEGSAWSLAPIGVVHVNVDTADQIRDGRSWTEVLDDNLASLPPIGKTIAELADDPLAVATLERGPPPVHKACEVVDACRSPPPITRTKTGSVRCGRRQAWERW